MDFLHRCRLALLLTFFLNVVPVMVEGHGGVLRRQKREWILAPRTLTEGHDYTTYNHIARIRSDKETDRKITYSLTGPGVDQNPVGRFAVDRNTGFVKVFSILDREEMAKYELKGLAKYADGTRAENDIDLIINVVDINDCTPVIKMQQVGQVSEHSKPGTVVMKVIATDDDDKNTPHAEISYRIDQRSNPGGMFTINSETGEVMVAKTTLDRETKDTYKLIILASDMGGRAGGNTGSGEIEIKLTDINDNVPTLEKETYEGKVEENTIGVEVLRVKAVDLDLVNTENWFAMYEIVSGNEGGYFDIQTDKNTNEGVITIKKALDYEEIKSLNLGVKVKNEADYNSGSSMVSTGASSKSYPIKINVVNQNEGPRFQPSVKVVTISEEQTSTSLNKVVATYPAIDSDTLKTATNVRYAKLDDKDNWFTIDEKTAEIRLNKYPDRESTSLINGTYYAEIICISNDVSPKTATGTIAIQVEDFNDNCPRLNSTTQTMCYGDNVIYVTAHDKDFFPNSAPFDFKVIQGDSKEKWILEPFNQTTVLLRDQEGLWPGTYKVSMEVKDQQGKSCDDLQIIDVSVCTCDKTKVCKSRTTGSATFGAAGILLMLLGLLLLLLIPLLLLVCLCGSAARDFKPIPFEQNEHLISYHTEGQGEDKEVPLLQVPVHTDSGTINIKDVNLSGGQTYLDHFGSSGAAMDGRGTLTGQGMNMYNTYNYNYSTGQDQMDFMGGGTMAGQDMSFSKYRLTAFDGMALPDHYLGQYYSEKTSQALHQHQEMEAKVNYKYEGQGSLAGSVGCCSLLENEDDLAFLDDLGPKFKTLAEICQGTTLESTSFDVGVSNLSNQTVSSVRPSTSTHTHVNTHTETVRDRDHMNANAFNIHNEASGSSTFIREKKITESSKGSATLPKVQETVVIPNQTLLIQQPAMYYAAAPMYVVEPNPQMLLVSGGTQQVVSQVNQAGLNQGLIQVGGLQGSQGVMLVEGQVGMKGASGQVAQGLTQGTVSESTKVFVAENGSGGGAHYMQSSDHIVGGLQGSQGVMLVEGQVGMKGASGQVAQGLTQGTVSESTKVFIVENGSRGGTHYMHSSDHIPPRSSKGGFEVVGKGVQMKSSSGGSHGSAGSKEDFVMTTTPRFQGDQRVVYSIKKSVTERNIESSI